MRGSGASRAPSIPVGLKTWLPVPSFSRGTRTEISHVPQIIVDTHRRWSQVLTRRCVPYIV